MAKKYLTKIQGFKDDRYLVACIGFYHDTPDLNHRIYYMGDDVGRRYKHLGHAAHSLEKTANAWEKYHQYIVHRTYETKEEFNERYDV